MRNALAKGLVYKCVCVHLCIMRIHMYVCILVCQVTTARLIVLIHATYKQY